MPSEKIRELYNELKDAPSERKEYAEFLSAMESLNTEMEQLMEPDEEGWKLLDQERLSSLTQKYRDAGTKLERYLAKTRNSQDAEELQTRAKAVKLAELLAADMSVLRAYKPATEAEQKSLPTLLEEARIPTLDLSKSSVKTVGNVLSERLAVKYVGPDGNVIAGMLTKAKVFDPLGEANRICKAASEKAATEEGKNLLLNLMTAYKAWYTDNPDADHPVSTVPDMVDGFLFSCRKEANEYDMSETKLLATIARVNGLTPQQVKTMCGKTAIKSLLEDMADITSETRINANVNHLNNKTRIDKKNAGMSTVAELLGVPELICKAQPMKIKNPDGSIIEGTFQHYAEGIDPLNPGRAAYFMDNEPMKNTNGKGMMQLADLQVIDYICGNTDRHGGNIFYIIGQDGKLAGIQGIDNDSSFGMILPKGSAVKFLQPPANMKVISKAMADKIVNLHPAELAFSLRGQVEEPAIVAACQRLQAMQKFVLESREKVRKGGKGDIRELTQNQFARLNPDAVKDEARRNIFFNAAQSLRRMPDMASLGREQVEPDMVGIDNRATEGGVRGQYIRGSAMEKLLKDRTSKWRGSSSQNYLNLEKAVRDYKELQRKLYERMQQAKERVERGEGTTEDIYAQYVTPSDMNKMRKSLKTLKEMADTYATGKLAELERKGKTIDSDEYIKKRINAAQEISDFAEKSMATTDEEKETLMANDRRSTEQYARVTVKKEKAKAEGPLLNL